MGMSAAVYQRLRHAATAGAALLACCSALVTASPASRPAAAGDGRSGTLLFADSFTDSARHEWSFDGDSVWSVHDGRLRAALPAERQVWSFARVGSAAWRDYSVDLDVCGVRGVDKGLALRVDGGRKGVGIDLRSSPFGDLLMYRGFEHWARAKVPHKNGTWLHVRLEARGNRYRAWVNSKLVVDFTDENHSRESGGIALAAYTGGNGECEVLFDNVEIRELR